MEVGDEEGDVISLDLISKQVSCVSRSQAYRHRLSSQDEEGLCSLGQESRELVHEDVFNLVRLFYPYANPDAVDRRLNKNALFLVPRDGEWFKHDLGRGLCLGLGDIVSLGGLRCEVR